jgi:hypothetical protein
MSILSVYRDDCVLVQEMPAIGGIRTCCAAAIGDVDAYSDDTSHGYTPTVPPPTLATAAMPMRPTTAHGRLPLGSICAGSRH